MVHNVNPKLCNLTIRTLTSIVNQGEARKIVEEDARISPFKNSDGPTAKVLFDVYTLPSAENVASVFQIPTQETVSSKEWIIGVVKKLLKILSNSFLLSLAEEDVSIK